jgi:hypothetical protein
MFDKAAVKQVLNSVEPWHEADFQKAQARLPERHAPFTRGTIPRVIAPSRGRCVCSSASTSMTINGPAANIRRRCTSDDIRRTRVNGSRLVIQLYYDTIGPSGGVL